MTGQNNYKGNWTDGSPDNTGDAENAQSVTDSGGTVPTGSQARVLEALRKLEEAVAELRETLDES